MGKRTTSRRIAMQALYQADISGISIEDAVKDITEDNISDATRDFALQLASGAFSNKKRIDEEISGYSVDWPLSRMSVLDRSILRMAFYEIIFEKGTPFSVVASEAVALAKKYGGSQSSSFINGILGSFIKRVKESGK